ncbi:hypothetical protein FOL47_002364 [Perkinsus chesapeaki]|uniref:Uncharacterized protein n=1 Tax=Perkinsus chesapeaki TaxID=330153 RepID=A0A7J6MEC6_PERCH|nr:hypothetical protein FOL47_002364 [Perkinsus chesapeaki]
MPQSLYNNTFWFSEEGGKVMVSISKPVMLDIPRRNEDSSEVDSPTTAIWTPFVILQVLDASANTTREIFRIVDLPLTDLPIFATCDTVLRLTLYAAKDRPTVQRLVETDDFTSELEGLPILPSWTERSIKPFVSYESEPVSPSNSQKGVLADAYFAGECALPIRAVGERFGGGMIMQWIALDQKGFRTDSCWDDNCTSVSKASALFRDLLLDAQEVWTPKICISLRDAEFPLEDRLPLPTQVAVWKSRQPAKRDSTQSSRDPQRFCDRLREGTPCVVSDPADALRDNEYVRALSKNLEGSRSLSSTPQRDDVLASLREFSSALKRREASGISGQQYGDYDTPGASRAASVKSWASPIRIPGEGGDGPEIVRVTQFEG